MDEGVQKAALTGESYSGLGLPGDQKKKKVQRIALNLLARVLDILKDGVWGKLQSRFLPL